MVKYIYKRQLFMGAGDESMSDAYELVTSLITSISELGALQQGAPSNKAEAMMVVDSIELTAENIYTALTGKKIVETRKIPMEEYLNNPKREIIE